MSRLDGLICLRESGRKALVPFITAGDPSLAATVPVMHALVAAGADVLELGVPFSDPMADGPVIQRSSERALARGAGLAYVLDSVRQFRVRDADTPVVLMGYLNPVEIRGYARFAAEATMAGVDGVLLVDLPQEEAGEARTAFAQHGLALIMLASPTTPDARLAGLCRDAQGYLYYVSFAGVTGAGHLDAGEAGKRLRTIRSLSQMPVMVGFGIKDAASAAAMAVDADGVVVGSALVAALAEAADCVGAHAGGGEADAADTDAVVARAAAFLAPLRAALDAGGTSGLR